MKNNVKRSHLSRSIDKRKESAKKKSKRSKSERRPKTEHQTKTQHNKENKRKKDRLIREREQKDKERIEKGKVKRIS